MWLGIDEPWIAKLAQRYIKPEDVVYDIGAHIGYTCLVFAKCLGNTGVVHGFEILPFVASLLKKTVEINNFDNIVIHPTGLSNQEQNLELQIGETMMTSLYSVYRPQPGKTEFCHTVQLDKYVQQENLPYPTLMKIDIEGAEFDCLLGGNELIKASLPLMIIEFHTKDLLQKGYSLLSPLGYRFLIETDQEITPQFLKRLAYFHASVFCIPVGKRP